MAKPNIRSPRWRYGYYSSELFALRLRKVRRMYSKLTHPAFPLAAAKKSHYDTQDIGGVDKHARFYLVSRQAQRLEFDGDR